jgi:DNA-binding response OmpR family regulator
MASKGKVLVIDDEPEITEIIQAFLVNAGYVVKIENSSTSGLDSA